MVQLVRTPVRKTGDLRFKSQLGHKLSLNIYHLYDHRHTEKFNINNYIDFIHSSDLEGKISLLIQVFALTPQLMVSGVARKSISM